MSDVDRRTLLSGLAGAASGALLARDRVQAAEPRWQPRASLPWATQEIYPTVANGRIVVAGGLAPMGNGLLIHDRTGIYDPAADRWEEGPRLPEPRHHPMLVTAGDGRVYLFSGLGRGNGGEWSAKTDVWVLDRGRWTGAAPMPAPLCESIGALLDGRLHLVTGRRPGGAANANWLDQVDVTDHHVFDPRSSRWETARPALSARNSAAGAVIDGVLYIAGGRTVDGAMRTRTAGNEAWLDRYDPRTDRWDRLAPMPRAQGGVAAAAVNGRLFVFGGEGDGAPANGVYPFTWIYDVATDRWTAGPHLRTPRHGLGGVAIGNTIYAVAGATRAGAAETSAILEALTV